MKSMTGYGYIEEQNDNFYITAELKSYNNRYCDIFVNTPQYLNPLEQKIREYLSPLVTRGRVEFSLRFRELEEDLDIRLDKKTAERFKSILNELAVINGDDAHVTLSHLLHMDGIIKIQRNQDIERYWKLVFPFVEKAFKMFDESRVREGKNTEKDILDSLNVIKKAADLFEKHADELEKKIISQLKEKFSQVVGEDFDQSRILNETAVMIVKYSISEEIVRLRSHIENFREIVKKGGPMGKKLDFVCQEMNREINTIGSKSIILEVNREVVEAKDGLERIREQLRNVE